LLDKNNYRKGWLKEAKITYYDMAATKIKEVIPINHGKKTGLYLLFSENGFVSTEGYYDQDMKVGKWVEYYPRTKIKKRETQYPKDPFDKETQPVVLQEYDERGKVINNEN
jgi:antitoxin component YwqK of YwqJK toxin-antitoxin module